MTREAGLLRYRGSQTATWFDFNNDGQIDLFVGNESWAGDKEPCELYRNNGDGTFTEVGASAGVAAIGVVKGVACGDYNNDGRQDLYLSIREQPNRLFRNDGPQNPAEGGKSPWKFSEVGAEAGVSEPLHSFPTWFFDYNNDGLLDLFVAGYRIMDVGDVAADYLGARGRGTRSKLYLNTGDGKFRDVSSEAKLDKVLLAMGSNFGDLDNDGWLDFYLGTGDPDLSTLIPNRMFRNAEGKFFQDVTTAGRFGHLQKGHAVAFADLDNDGDQDVYAVMGGAYEGDVYRRVLFENPGQSKNWVKLKLEGVQSNRSAIGARLKITVVENGVTRQIYKTVNSGGSFGANPLRQEIGLGSAAKIRELEVFWPTTGQTQKFENIPANKTWYLVEGRTALQELRVKRFAWKRGSPGHHEGN